MDNEISKDIYYEYDGQTFVWDKAKYDYNLDKHKITFEEAATIFSDEDVILEPDKTHSVEEERFIAIGLSCEFHILVVCHCEREDGEVIRIINARKAKPHERKRFEQESGKLDR